MTKSEGVFGAAEIPPHFTQQGIGRFVPEFPVLFERKARLEIKPCAKEPLGVGRHQLLMRNSLKCGYLLRAGRPPPAGI